MMWPFSGTRSQLEQVLKRVQTPPPQKDPEPVPTADFIQGDYFSGVFEVEERDRVEV